METTMTDEEILQKAIEKGEKNGFIPQGTAYAIKTMPNEIKTMAEAAFYGGIIDYKQYYQFIFSHDFAKSFWGEENSYDVYICESDDNENGTVLVDTIITDWQYHLQQLVLCESPIQYLANFIYQ